MASFAQLNLILNTEPRCQPAASIYRATLVTSRIALGFRVPRFGHASIVQLDRAHGG